MVSKNAKIMLGLGSLVALIGLIMILVAVLTAASGLEMTFEQENSKSMTLTAPNAQHCGWSIYIAEESDCMSFSATVIDPEGNEQPFYGSCGGGLTVATDGNFQNAGHIMLTDKTVYNADGSFSPVYLAGDYKVQSSEAMWAMDFCGELGEAVGGIFAAIGLILTAICVIIAGAILCCVGCCCCKENNPPPGGGAQQPVVGEVVGAAA